MSQNSIQESLNLPFFDGDVVKYIEALHRELQRQWRNLAIVVNYSHQQFFHQATEPVLSTNSIGLWYDTVGNYYLLANLGGSQTKIALELSSGEGGFFDNWFNPSFM